MISLRFALYILVCTFPSVSFAEKRLLLSVVYNEWSLWNWCSAPCGITGVRNRTRGCHSTLFGLVNFNGKCDTGGEEKESCVGACPHTTIAATLYPGTWSQWTQFSTCDKTCGGGMHIRHRSCTSGTCVGDSIETASCSDHQCPGTWSSWGPFSPCDKTCEGGIQIRHRTCVSGPCIGDSLESASCNDHLCAGEIQTNISATPTHLTTTKATTNTTAMTQWATITSTIKATTAWKEFMSRSIKDVT
nr:A disintegrin and metalloproteinase with thrombospondin motifs adt-2 isoform X2 [Crassostrea gigas]